MPRKAQSTFETEKRPFPSRLRAIMKAGKVSQQALASAIGVKRQTISLYTTGQSSPDAERIKQIADFFEVSADWLLGISDLIARDVTVQEVCDLTGLSSCAAIRLKVEKDTDEPEIADFISYLISHPSLPDLIDALKQKNSFANTGEKVPVDVGKSRRVYEVEVEAVCKKIADDILRDIIDGYTVKFGEVLVDHVTG